MTLNILWRGYKILVQKAIQLNLFENMRQRYFSPQLRCTLPSQRCSRQQKLRMIGSSSQLPSTITIDDNQQRIGPYFYYTNKEIGSGYSSKVYKGKKKDCNEEYAIKVIELKKYSSSNMEMLNNEIDILQSLHHPNIIRCYDIFKTSTKCYIVMEYCPHGDLLTYLTKNGKLHETKAVEIVQQITEGCKYLLSKDIIHRDIKPANIIKGRTQWKIADFGFAIKSSTQFKSRYNVGTPLYMPPESLIKNIYSPKTDIFAVGILLYEMLCACTPWESRTEKDLIRKMTSLPFKIPEKVELSTHLKSILNQLCAVEATERMGKQQFFRMKFAAEKECPEQTYYQIPLRKSLQPSEIKSFRATSIEHFISSQPQYVPSSSTKLKTVQSQSTNSNQEEESNEVWRKIETRNNHVLVNQLHYCRFLYYLIQNSSSLLIQQSGIEKLNLILFKHLLKTIKQISDSRNNWFKLKEWADFKSCKKYLNTYLTMKQYANRYEKEYLNYLKSAQVNIIRQINKQMPQFSSTGSFSVEFYGKLLHFVSPLIREANHNLGAKIVNSDLPITKELIGSIQALKSLQKYYQLIEMSITHFEDYAYFESHSQIKVHVDYRRVSTNTVTGYLQLRKQLKNI